jgi:hypothetical protein
MTDPERSTALAGATLTKLNRVPSGIATFLAQIMPDLL